MEKKIEIIILYKDVLNTAINNALERLHGFLEALKEESFEEKQELLQSYIDSVNKYQKLKEKINNNPKEITTTEISMLSIVITQALLEMQDTVDKIYKAAETLRDIAKILVN